MLKFEKITKRDISTIKNFTQNCGVRSCDFTLCGIYLWGVYYDYEICVFEETLFIKGVDESGRQAFALPIGKLQGKKAVEIVRNYCNNHAVEARFSFVPAERLDDLKGGNAKKLVGWSDYIYDAESLANLSGKALHKKKNRFNKFVKTNPDHSFEKVTEANVDELREFYLDFLAKNPTEDARLNAEAEIIKKAIDEFSILGLDGGILKVDNKVVAFAIGEKVGDTLYVHFEKADRKFDGCYEAMNMLFVKNFKRDAKFVDREEDMDDEGLRQAKNAYNPLFLADKYEFVFP
jgi:hypothetical protein